MIRFPRARLWRTWRESPGPWAGRYLRTRCRPCGCKRGSCIGGWPTSKVLREWLQQADPQTVLLTDRVDNMDGLRLRTQHVRGGFDAWCAAYTGKISPGPYTRRWL